MNLRILQLLSCKRKVVITSLFLWPALHHISLCVVLLSFTFRANACICEIKYFEREHKETKIKKQKSEKHGGGGSSIVMVPGDVPPARVCFFKPSSLAKGILFANFRPYFLAIFVKELSNFGKEILFFKFWSLECKNLASFA